MDQAPGRLVRGLRRPAFGSDPATGQPRQASGIVAVGTYATGLIAVGDEVCGVFATGLLEIGVVPVGLLLALGFFSVMPTRY